MVDKPPELELAVAYRRCSKQVTKTIAALEMITLSRFKDEPYVKKLDANEPNYRNDSLLFGKPKVEKVNLLEVEPEPEIDSKVEPPADD